jgi:hypothetical protein
VVFVNRLDLFAQTLIIGRPVNILEHDGDSTGTSIGSSHERRSAHASLRRGIIKLHYIVT